MDEELRFDETEDADAAAGRSDEEPDSDAEEIADAVAALAYLEAQKLIIPLEERIAALERRLATLEANQRP